MMMKLTCLSCSILVVFVLYFGVCCNGEAESVAAPMEEGEQEALYSAIQGFVGKWWNGSDLYPDPCGWTPIQGVSCDLFDDLWYVTELNIGPIHDNSLDCAPNVELSPHLFALKHLKSLSFFNCFVSPVHHPITILIENWEVLAGSLESLEFRSNPGLIGQIPASFAQLWKLRSLVLIENGLTGELPTNLGNLVNLRRLVLAGNGFSGKIPDSFGGLNHLLIFDMSRNALSGPLPLTFGGLTSLLKLDLSNNKLEDKIPQEIGNLKNLTLLDLSNNRFSGGLTKSLQEMSSLEELVMSNNPMGGDLMSIEWHSLRGLTILDLANTRLTGGIPDSITELKCLRFLGLNDNKLTGEISPKLAALPNVTAIYLNGNDLTGELKFSELFYEKMGRRFGVWNNNPSLCYPIGSMSSTSHHAPFGVKPCQQEITLDEINSQQKSSLGNEISWNHNPNSIASLGSSRWSDNGVWYILLVEMIIVMLAL